MAIESSRDIEIWVNYETKSVTTTPPPTALDQIRLAARRLVKDLLYLYIDLCIMAEVMWSLYTKTYSVSANTLKCIMKRISYRFFAHFIENILLLLII